MYALHSTPDATPGQEDPTRPCHPTQSRLKQEKSEGLEENEEEEGGCHAAEKSVRAARE